MLRLFAQAEHQIRSGSPLHLPLELALVESILDSEDQRLNPGDQRGEVAPTSSAQQPTEEMQIEPAVLTNPDPKTVAEESQPPSASTRAEGEVGLAQVETVWPDILREVRIRSVSAELGHPAAVLVSENTSTNRGSSGGRNAV